MSKDRRKGRGYSCVMSCQQFSRVRHGESGTSEPWPLIRARVAPGFIVELLRRDLVEQSGKRCPIANSEPLVNFVKMDLHRSLCDDQSPRYLLIRVSFHSQSNNLALPWGKTAILLSHDQLIKRTLRWRFADEKFQRAAADIIVLAIDLQNQQPQRFRPCNAF